MGISSDLLQAKALSERTSPSSQVMDLFEQQGFSLSSGGRLAKVQVAYKTYGQLNDDCSNAIYICHALTGDQYVASENPITQKPGWWDILVGPGKPIDTTRFFVICSNVLGGCMGTTGPASVNPENGHIYGLDFPLITIRDMVDVQVALVRALGIDQLLCVIGGSMGGMQTLAWSVYHPDRLRGAMTIASAPRHSAQNIAFHEVGRQAIMADPSWHQGRYFEQGTLPLKGLSVARMTAHITYLSEETLTEKFGRNLQDKEHLTYSFDADFQVESYLRHQGLTFVDRFDANSYLYLTRAMDYFDLAHSDPEFHGVLANAFRHKSVSHCVMSFSSDWLFPTFQSKMLVRALHAAGCRVSFVEIESVKGHDSFLLHVPEFFDSVSGFLDSLGRDVGV